MAKKICPSKKKFNQICKTDKDKCDKIKKGCDKKEKNGGQDI